MHASVPSSPTREPWPHRCRATSSLDRPRRSLWPRCREAVVSGSGSLCRPTQGSRAARKPSTRSGRRPMGQRVRGSVVALERVRVGRIGLGVSVDPCIAREEVLPGAAEQQAGAGASHRFLVASKNPGDSGRLTRIRSTSVIRSSKSRRQQSVFKDEHVGRRHQVTLRRKTYRAARTRPRPAQRPAHRGRRRPQPRSGAREGRAAVGA